MLGTGSQILWASLFTLTVEFIPDIKGTVSSVFNSSRFLGYAISPLILGSVYLEQGYDAVLVITAITITVAIGLSILLRSKVTRTTPIGP